MTILHRTQDNRRIKTVEGTMAVTSQYTVGVAGEKFFRALKDKGELLGSHCLTCKISYLPAKHFCERCMSRLEEYRKAPLEGKLESFTKITIGLDEKKLKEPAWVGFVRFKDFEGGLIHYLQISDEKKLRVGATAALHLQPKDQRTGSILDIIGFRIS